MPASIRPLMVLAALAVCSYAWAQTPERIHYQGHLTNEAGTPITCIPPFQCDQPLTMTFRFHDDPDAGEELWSEVHEAVPIEAGLFNITLGQITPVTAELLAGPRWLSVEINGNGELSPRQEIVSAAYAIRSQEATNASTLDGLGVESFVQQNGFGALEDKIAALEATVIALQEAGGNGPFVGPVHTSADCIAAGGIVEPIVGGESLCRFNASACPSGWTPLANWSATTTCLAKSTGCGIPPSCISSSHPFLNQAPEQCCVKGNKDVGIAGCVAGAGPQACCTAPVVQVGCF